MGKDQNKRKRAAEGKGDSDEGGQRKKERETKGKDTLSTPSSPTEEEFNEFVAILGRMEEAVKYFGKTSSGVNGGREMHKSVVQTEEPSSRRISDVELCLNKSGRDAVLDLNTIPEEESSRSSELAKKGSAYFKNDRGNMFYSISNIIKLYDTSDPLRLEV
ncbi:hypothetical protein L1887_14725 [Cichorium endivia]|nr:hypothetical protein L1887_14725 [Cichorium endivia]